MENGSNKVKISVKELTEVCIKAVSTLGYTSDEAGKLVDCMLAAQLRGNNQGIIKITTGGLNKHPDEIAPKIIHETPVSARIDGRKSLGMSVLVQAVKLAAGKALTSGLSLVTTSNTPNSTGYLGWYCSCAESEIRCPVRSLRTDLWDQSDCHFHSRVGRF